MNNVKIVTDTMIIQYLQRVCSKWGNDCHIRKVQGNSLLSHISMILMIYIFVSHDRIFIIILRKLLLLRTKMTTFCVHTLRWESLFTTLCPQPHQGWLFIFSSIFPYHEYLQYFDILCPKPHQGWLFIIWYSNIMNIFQYFNRQINVFQARV